jgi:hypothetical protein
MLIAMQRSPSVVVAYQCVTAMARPELLVARLRSF